MNREIVRSKMEEQKARGIAAAAAEVDTLADGFFFTRWSEEERAEEEHADAELTRKPSRLPSFLKTSTTGCGRSASYSKSSSLDRGQRGLGATQMPRMKYCDWADSFAPATQSKACICALPP